MILHHRLVAVIFEDPVRDEWIRCRPRDICVYSMGIPSTHATTGGAPLFEIGSVGECAAEHRHGTRKVADIVSALIVTNRLQVFRVCT
eukprot:COSAG02_NODE_1152_length_14201_cov_9.055595_6_plen_88_part_00